MFTKAYKKEPHAAQTYIISQLLCLTLALFRLVSDPHDSVSRSYNSQHIRSNVIIQLSFPLILYSSTNCTSKVFVRHGVADQVFVSLS